MIHRPHYKIKKRLASIERQVQSARLQIVEAIQYDEARVNTLDLLKQIEDLAGSAYEIIEADRQRVINDSLEGDK